MTTSYETTPAQDISAEIDEAASDLRRARRHLEFDHPTLDELELALRAISDAVQRVEYATLLLKAEMKRR